MPDPDDGPRPDAVPKPDAAPAPGRAPAGRAPQIAVRVAVTTGETTVRTDLALQGSRGTWRTGQGPVRSFTAAELWPTVRALLPDEPLLRADPAISSPDDQHTPGADLAEAVRHGVSIAVGADGGDADVPGALAVRTWLVTERELYAVEPGPHGESLVVSHRAGALAATLEWDVAGALEHLVRALEGRGAA